MGGKFRFETLTNPTRQLSDERAASLRASILTLNQRLSDAPAFQENWAARIDTFLETTDILDLAWMGDELVGHYGERVVTVDGVRLYYVDSFTVSPELQRSGLGKKLAMRANLRALRRTGLGESFIASRTSNPHVAAGIWRGLKRARHFYPSFDPGQGHSPRLRGLAEGVSRKLWSEKSFEPETGVLVGAYGGTFIPVRMTSEADVAAHFGAHVDPERGDAIVQIVRFSPGAYLRLVRYFMSGLRRR